METLKCIKTRRSIRKFKNKEVPKDIINKLIDAGRCAPSSMDCQPWEFVSVGEKATKEKLAELKGKENKPVILGANLILIVCVDRNKSSSRWIEDGTVATENILLAAHDLGLGAVYVTGFSPKDPKVELELQKILKLPKHIIPVCIIPVGYPDQKPEPKGLRSLGNMIHNEKW